MCVQVLPPEDRVSICTELTEHTLRCVRDQNGNHVVQVRGGCWVFVIFYICEGKMT